MAASVSSLDKDLKSLRLSKYTPQAAEELRGWIEESLGDAVPSGDILDALKDGTILCRLVNAVKASPSIKYKQSRMPFVQMENISHFLRAMQSPPFSLPDHDVFLTVDLYENKDPAQVIQSMCAFSRVAHSLNPSIFRRAIGPRAKSVLSSQNTGSSVIPVKNRDVSSMSSASHLSNSTYASTQSSNTALSQDSATLNRFSKSTNARPASRDGAAVSSWSSRQDEGRTAPAWNIAQYGYMGGASQGNQGVSFGARRQITAQSPRVPSLAEKERRRREEDAETKRLENEKAENDRRRQAELAAEEERARQAEAEAKEREAKSQREAERRALEEEKKQWDEEERRWKAEEEERKQEEAAAALPKRPPQKPLAPNPMKSQSRTPSGHILNGQMLSQYHQSAPVVPKAISPAALSPHSSTPSEQDRIAELERQLAEAKERERRYQEEERRRHGERTSHEMHLPTAFSLGRSGRNDGANSEETFIEAPAPLSETPTVAHLSSTPPVLSHSANDSASPRATLNEPVPRPANPTPITASSRPLPNPASYRSPISAPRTVPSLTKSATEPLWSPPPASNTPLPPPPVTPLKQPSSPTKNWNTTSYLNSNPAPQPVQPITHSSAELSGTSASEQHAESKRNALAVQKTKTQAWASSSLLEREMERERERQREWEASQKESKAAAATGVGRNDPANRVGEGGAWDVNAYGWTGGDSQNRGTQGIGAGRRQIIGPRPPPS